MALRLALAIEDGQAGCRHNTIGTTGERYWWWPGEPHPDGGNTEWWLLPERTERTARRARAYAIECARAMIRERQTAALDQALAPPAWFGRLEHETMRAAVRICLLRLARRAGATAHPAYGDPPRYDRTYLKRPRIADAVARLPPRFIAKVRTMPRTVCL
jgi:hypothetical protein